MIQQLKDMIQRLKNQFSSWRKKAIAAGRTELERYLDRRVEELLQPEHWERAVKSAKVMSDPKWEHSSAYLCGLRITWSVTFGARVYCVSETPSGSAFTDLRPDLQQQFQEAFARTWPNDVPHRQPPRLVPTLAAVIDALETARKAAGCPEHEGA